MLIVDKLIMEPGQTRIFGGTNQIYYKEIKKEVRNYQVKHLKMSGRHRNNILMVSLPKPSTVNIRGLDDTLYLAM